MLERYVIVERIAVGGMGEVFVARQEGVGNFRRTVVLKKLLPDAEGSDEAARRLLDEARISAALSHENVVSIIEVGTEQELPWLALEYVHGENCGTLRNKAAKRGIAIPVVVAAQIVKDSARGLAHAHAACDVDGRPLRIIHRDIAPKNLFVRHDGVSKVGDFGIARADDRLSHTATGAIAGTLTYMSPEQLSSKTLTPLSDQFALGVVFWELLTGRRLFKADGPVETAEKILAGKIRAPSRYREDLAAFPDVDRVVLRMLERDPQKRFPDCAEVVAAIEAAVKETASSVGRAAVAAFVEEMVGPELRERQRRIEEGAEQTVRSDRPKAWDDPPSSKKSAGVAASPGGDVADSGVPADVVDGDPTLRDRAPPVASSEGIRPITRPTRPTPASPRPPPASWATKPSRAPLYAGAVIALVVAVAAVFVSAARRDDPDRQMREHLHRAARIKPLSFREVVVVDSTAVGVDEATAEALADDLTALMRERLDLEAGHWDKPAAKRAQERVAVKNKDRDIIERMHARLAKLDALVGRAGAAPTAADVAQLKTDLFEMWQYDSSAPIRFLPPLSLEQIQARIYPNGIALLNETRAERWEQVDLLVKRAGADPAQVRALLEPLVAKREALLVKFGTAPPDRLQDLEDDAAAVVVDGERALKGVVDDDVAEAVAYVAFISVPSSRQGEPEIDMHADTR